MPSLRLLVCLSVFASCVQAAPVNVVQKSNVSFGAQGLMAPRPDETFTSGPATEALTHLIVDTVREDSSLLPSKFHAVPMTIYLEDHAQVRYPDGTSENTPLSVVTSMQNPSENSIRLGTYDVADDPAALRSVLAHEMGHMLVEWASRQSGVTPANQPIFSAWSKAIYEGVADFISATVTRSTIIGDHSWTHRDILGYEKSSLEDAGRDHLTLRQAEQGLPEVHLVPQYQVYRDTLDMLEKVFAAPDTVDPYAEGDWLAGKLWEGSHEGQCADRIATRAIELGASGAKFDDPVKFLAALQPELCAPER